MNGERFDRLTRALAGQTSRRRVLGMLGAAVAGGVSASWWAAPAQADDDDRMTVTGLTVAQARQQGPVGSSQAVCAHTTIPAGVCFGGTWCSHTCPQGASDLGGCFARVGDEGNSFCGANIACDEATTCSRQSDCPPGTVCAQTCCGVPVCLPVCNESFAAA